jgi:alanine racemase
VKRKIIYSLANAVAVYEEDSIKYPIPEVNEIDVNLSQLQRNYAEIRKLLKPNIKFMAVLKGDAYGHGMLPIAHELENCKVDAFGVVRLIEAYTLRASGIKTPIVLLAPIIPSQASWIVKYSLTPMVDNYEILKVLQKSAEEESKIVNVHVKVNTGLNRYGVMYHEALDFIKIIHNQYRNIRVEGIYTHFQDAEFNMEFTRNQLNFFNKLLYDLEREKIRPKIAHAAGSAGILMYPEAHYDMVRCGIILYGLEHKEGEKNLPEGVKPLITLKGRIMKLRTLKPGEVGGYGSNFKAKKDTRLAIIGVGYGDGVTRGWKEVLIAGKRAPVVNYFMDGIMADITELGEEVKEFDEAVIIGHQGEEYISWEEASKNINSYADEQIQRITERVPKYYFYE